MIPIKLEITKQAADWYKQEYELTKQTYIRLFVRYGGVGGLIPGFSLGINIEEPDVVHSEKTIDDLTFFIEETDAWYFEGNNLNIIYNENKQEPEFIYK